MEICYRDKLRAFTVCSSNDAMVMVDVGAWPCFTVFDTVVAEIS